VDQFRVTIPIAGSTAVDCRFMAEQRACVRKRRVAEDANNRQSYGSGRTGDRASSRAGGGAGPNELKAPTQPDASARRPVMAGNSQGRAGVAALKRMLADDPSEKVWEQVIFAAQPKQGAGRDGDRARRRA